MCSNSSRSSYPICPTPIFTCVRVNFARFGSQNFGNQFIPIVNAADNTIVGYESCLWVRTALGSAVPVDRVFDALTNLDEVVFRPHYPHPGALNFFRFWLPIAAPYYP